MYCFINADKLLTNKGRERGLADRNEEQGKGERWAGEEYRGYVLDLKYEITPKVFVVVKLTLRKRSKKPECKGKKYNP